MHHVRDHQRGDLLVTQRADIESGAVAWRAIGDRDIDFALRPQIQRLGSRGQADVDRRVQRQEARQSRAQPLERQTGRAVHRQHLVLRGQLHLGATRFERAKQTVQALKQPLPLPRGLHLTMAALKQRPPKVLFQVAYLVADGRSREVQLLRGQRKALQARGRFEGAQAGQRWKISHANDFQMN